ncbi:unnamed protein product [Lymnaea stagnalis]|uniref:Tetraspanin n=1 Tax=Lymnaea stagnalis TaxID=6523 RepID=A0AAV2IH11_LYMST
MGKFDYMLAVTMAISLIWGIIILAFGAVIRFSFGKLISNYVAGVTELVPSSACTNTQGQNICPIGSKIGDEIDVGDWPMVLGAFVIVTGVLVTIFSVLGFVAALKHSTPLIILFIVFCLIATGIQFYLVQIATTEEIAFHNDAKSQLIEKLKNEYTVDGKNLFTIAMNSIMITAECCGVSGVGDFGNLTFVEKSGINENLVQFTVPPACCPRQLFLEGSTEAKYTAIKECARSGLEKAEPNKRSCYTTVFTDVNEKYGAAVMGLLLFIIVWEMLQIVLGVLVKFTPPPKEERKSAVEHRGSTVPRDSIAQPKIKKFVPFSKVSSFTAADIGRIKSTEIW